jgi:hypothetical protein
MTTLIESLKIVAVALFGLISFYALWILLEFAK